jgi:hypothetical protein
VTLPCGHPLGCMTGNDYLGGDCEWCSEIDRVRDESDERVARLAQVFADVQHSVPGMNEPHDYVRLDPRGCPVCEVLDMALVGNAVNDADQERLRRFRADGLLFLVNAAVLHPRGYALAMQFNSRGDPEGLGLVGDGDEPWAFAREGLDETIDGLVAGEQAREAEWTPLLRKGRR